MCRKLYSPAVAEEAPVCIWLEGTACSSSTSGDEKLRHVWPQCILIRLHNEETTLLTLLSDTSPNNSEVNWLLVPAYDVVSGDTYIG